MVEKYQTNFTGNNFIVSDVNFVLAYLEQDRDCFYFHRNDLEKIREQDEKDAIRLLYKFMTFKELNLEFQDREIEKIKMVYSQDKCFLKLYVTYGSAKAGNYGYKDWFICPHCKTATKLKGENLKKCSKSFLFMCAECQKLNALTPDEISLKEKMKFGGKK